MMMADTVRFEGFALATRDRLLTRDGARVDLSPRYFDALVLLVHEAGALVSKDRFLDEVWRGVPVTDEALTQCIRTLRRMLGDEAARPRFIETVPKHGYRFIAPVVAEPRAAAMSGHRPRVTVVHRILLLGGAGSVGGGLAGLACGLLYGFGGASQPLGPAMGATSVLLVLMCLSIVAGLIGGIGVGFGIALAELFPRRRFPATMITGAAGGLVVGAIAKLLGLDAFTLLLGQAPRAITGGLEGAALGAAVGLAAWLAERRRCNFGRGLAVAALLGAITGGLVTAFGGILLGGSLAAFARDFPGSRLRLDQFGALVGEHDFGPLIQALTGIVEGALFALLIVAARGFVLRAVDGTDDAVSASQIPLPSS